MRKQQRILKHIADPPVFRRQVDSLRGIEQGHVVDANVSARRLGDSGDGIDHAALARTGTAEETDNGRVGRKFDREVKCTQPLIDVNVDHCLASVRSAG